MATSSIFANVRITDPKIAKDEHGIPFVKMPVAGRYVAMELAKKENRRSLYKIVDKDKRRDWVTQRMKSIVRDIRQLEAAIRDAGKDKLFRSEEHTSELQSH